MGDTRGIDFDSIPSITTGSIADVEYNTNTNPMCACARLNLDFCTTKPYNIIVTKGLGW